MARALLSDPTTDDLQFILAGFSLGLAGDGSPRSAKGAAALLEASRRDDYPHGLAAELSQLAAGAVPIEAFRAAALSDTEREDPGEFEHAAAAFRAAADPRISARLSGVLGEVGAMAEATSHSTAVALITHATGLGDVAKLRLISQAAGARASAAAKRLQRDGRLLEVARGQLTVTRDLAAALTASLLAFIGLIGILGAKAFLAGRRFWLHMNGDDESDLVDISRSNWRPL
jgi:hypothetical protein